MKHKFKMIISASAGSAFAFTALAQSSVNPAMDSTAAARQCPPTNCAVAWSGTTQANKVIGMTVQNYQHQRLGKVDDLLLDVESGRIVQVILASGGFLGIDETLTAVPPDALHHQAGQRNLHLDISQEKFKAAPKFEAANWDEGTQSNQVAEVYGYYGEQPYFVANPVGNWAASSAGSFNADGASSVNNVNYAASSAGDTNAVATGDPAGALPRNDDSHDYPAGASGSVLGYVQPERKLIGTTVWNLQGEKLGTVKNFVVDLPSGRIVAVVVSSGGFIGINRELSAIPPTALQYDEAQDILQLDVTKDALAGAPHFPAGQWPDFSQPEYTDEVYRAYHVKPYAAANGEAAAANSGQNIRDRGGRTLTPLDQGGSQADIAITAGIRRAILAEAGLSLNAQNVKIITINGRVTLRGPVNSPGEKQTIGDIAARLAQPGNVDNELDAPLVSSN